MRRLAVEMLKEAPTPALRACAPLAQVYQPLAWELFNAAFIACWSELTNRMEIATGGFKAATRPAPLDHTHASAPRLRPAASQPHPAASLPHPHTPQPHPAASRPHPAASRLHPNTPQPHPAASRLHRSACVPRRSPSSPHSSSRWTRSLRRQR